MTDQEQEFDFRRRLAHAPGWLAAGRDMFDLADVAWEQIRFLFRRDELRVDGALADITILRSLALLKPYYFVAGTGIENLLKAIIVLERFKRVDGSVDDSVPNELPRDLRSHNLTRLARFAKITFSQTERAHLRRLSIAILWQGRYPIPSSPKFVDDDGKPESFRDLTFGANDHASTREISRIIEGRYDELVSTVGSEMLERYRAYLEPVD